MSSLIFYVSNNFVAHAYVGNERPKRNRRQTQPFWLATSTTNFSPATLSPTPSAPDSDDTNDPSFTIGNPNPAEERQKDVHALPHQKAEGKWLAIAFWAKSTIFTEIMASFCRYFSENNVQSICSIIFGQWLAGMYAFTTFTITSKGLEMLRSSRPWEYAEDYLLFCRQGNRRVGGTKKVWPWRYSHATLFSGYWSCTASSLKTD